MPQQSHLSWGERQRVHPVSNTPRSNVPRACDLAVLDIVGLISNLKEGDKNTPHHTLHHPLLCVLLETTHGQLGQALQGPQQVLLLAGRGPGGVGHGCWPTPGPRPRPRPRPRP
jgi:hypothetical protein